MCDSGGQYKYGTTDITRTISLGNQSNEIKNIFTYVLKGHIAVANSNLNRFKSAHLIDSLARKYLKKGLDFLMAQDMVLVIFSMYTRDLLRSQKDIK